MKYAGFWRRFGAFIVDWIILLVPALILAALFKHSEFLSPVMAILYYPIFESSSLMGTPGKIFFGMQVTTEAGGRLSFGQAFLRYVLKFVSSLILFMGYLFNLFTAKRQTLHDILVGAVVIEVTVSTEQPWFEIWKAQVKSVMGMAGGTTAKVAEETARAFDPNTSTEATVRSRAEILDLVEQLHRLHQQGAISEDEFKSKKEDLLRGL